MVVVLPVDKLPVFWDINNCPVPNGYNPRLVGQCIKRFLSKLGHSGPISITAIGQLSKVPCDILEGISSAGITLYDVPFGRKDIVSHICIYCFRNSPPTDIVVISPPRYFSHTFSELIDKHGCNIILPFPIDSRKSEAIKLWQELLWEDLPAIYEPATCASWVCGVCDNIPGRGFSKFQMHINSAQHRHEFLKWFPQGEATTMLEEATKLEHPSITMLRTSATNVEESIDELSLTNQSQSISRWVHQHCNLSCMSNTCVS